MGFKRGEGGRPRGAKNKLGVAAKTAIAQAAAELGGVERLVAWAKEHKDNERAFWTVVFPKLVPHEVSGPDGGDIPIRQIIHQYITSGH